MTERQRQKVVFVKNVSELRRHFALHQLESDLGGTREVATKFLPFPLLAGPFDAGHAGGPSPCAARREHELRTPEVAQGCLRSLALGSGADASLRGVAAGGPPTAHGLEEAAEKVPGEAAWTARCNAIPPSRAANLIG